MAYKYLWCGGYLHGVVEIGTNQFAAFFTEEEDAVKYVNQLNDVDEKMQPTKVDEPAPSPTAALTSDEIRKMGRDARAKHNQQHKEE